MLPTAYPKPPKSCVQNDAIFIAVFPDLNLLNLFRSSYKHGREKEDKAPWQASRAILLALHLCMLGEQLYSNGLRCIRRDNENMFCPDRRR